MQSLITIISSSKVGCMGRGVVFIYYFPESSQKQNTFCHLHSMAENLSYTSVWRLFVAS
jgi:hypothetical protein